MKKKIILFFIMIFMFIITGCGVFFEDDYDGSEGSNNMETVKNIKVIINDEEYDVDLENNDTAKEFYNMLPISFNMSDLNDNEKYCYMNDSLHTNPSVPEKIVAGDIMLYGNDCLVIFYKSFTTSYSYTKIGHITNLPDLSGNSVTVKFEK